MHITHWDLTSFLLGSYLVWCCCCRKSAATSLHGEPECGWPMPMDSASLSALNSLHLTSQQETTIGNSVGQTKLQADLDSGQRQHPWITNWHVLMKRSKIYIKTCGRSLFTSFPSRYWNPSHAWPYPGDTTCRTCDAHRGCSTPYVYLYINLCLFI